MPSNPALKAAQTEATAAPEAPDYGTVTYDGVEYTIVRKPNTLLLSELARTGTGDPESMGVFSEFFETTLGANYRAFKRATYRSELEPAELEKALFAALQEVLEKTLARPTE